MAESEQSADIYDRVYAAERPELFFKSAAWRVSGPGAPVWVRADSSIDVPEPELAVVQNDPDPWRSPLFVCNGTPTLGELQIARPSRRYLHRNSCCNCLSQDIDSVGVRCLHKTYSKLSTFTRKLL